MKSEQRKIKPEPRGNWSTKLRFLKFLKKAETDQKYEETDQKFEETNPKYEGKDQF